MPLKDQMSTSGCLEKRLYPGKAVFFSTNDINSKCVLNTYAPDCTTETGAEFSKVKVAK
jgi:hypothetical protein